MIRFILNLAVLLKWFRDRAVLPLSYRDLYLYFKIHTYYYKELKKFPNLQSPSGLNDKIQWLKLFNKSYLTSLCSDKLAVKDYIQQEIGTGYTPLTLASGSSLSSIPLETLPKCFVLKTNHDSGSVFLIKDKSAIQHSELNKKISESLARTYGQESGEWNYQLIPPKVFAEEYIGDPSLTSPPPDYKFHCSNGKVLWVHYIYDRGNEMKEVVVNKDGERLPVHFDLRMIPSSNFSKPESWNTMIDIAEKLSKPFNYIRVDLFNVQGRVFVGELTFYPLTGCMKGQGQATLGKLVHISN